MSFLSGGAVLAVSWWCSSSPRNWTWSPSPYLGAWMILLGVIALAIWWQVRGRHAEPRLDAREAAALDEGSGPYPSSPTGRTIAFVLGMVFLWFCLDWPLASLGAGYLATAQMMRQVIMVLVVAPLLLFSCPAPLAVRLVGWGRRLTVLRTVSRPVLAVLIAATTLLAANAPAVLDPLVATPYGAFAMDLGWVIAGFVLWMPVQCPHPGVRRLEGPFALGYLILQSIVPVLPGFFMTWADFPIYSTYELAPRVFEGFDAVTDQQTAAAILQVGGMVILWLQISFRFLRWAYQQMDEQRVDRKPITAETAAARRRFDAVFVKICGITREDDALLAVAMGADAVGFIFAPSKRQVAPAVARDIVRRLPPEILTVGVFRDEAASRVVEIVNSSGLRAAQLHGHESAESTRWVRERVPFVIKGFPAGDPALASARDFGTDAILIDSPTPGSGEVFDWSLAEGRPDGIRTILAGGLDPQNVGDAVRRVKPWGVDVASGVERAGGEPGQKDARKVRAFIEAARAAAPAEDEFGPDPDPSGPYDWMQDGAP